MAMSDKYTILVRRIDLFNGLDPDDIAKIFAKGMTIQVGKGDRVFSKGATGGQMFVVLGGQIGIYDGAKLLAMLGTGDMFGEMALISNEPRSASAVATEDSSLFVLNASTFQRLLTKRVAIQILLNVIGTLCRRLRAANERLQQNYTG